MLQCVSSVIDYGRHQNVGRTSVTHSPNFSCATLLSITEQMDSNKGSIYQIESLRIMCAAPVILFLN